MKILLFSHYFPPEVNAPATRTFEHSVRWARAGHDVTVVTCVPNCPNGILFPGYKNRLGRRIEWLDGIRVVRVWTYLAANAGTVRRIANYLSYLVSATLASIRLPRPDLVVATSPQFFCGWAGVLVSRLKRAPLVLEIRDLWPESIQAVGAIRNRRVLRFLEWLERRMYQAAGHIVTVGEGYRQRIVEKANVAGGITVITNGVDLDRFIPREPSEAFRRRWNLDGKFVCSYVGTIGMAHGLDVVLRAATILQSKGRHDIVFCLVGDGALRAQLERETREAGLAELVVFTGRQPKEHVPAILASSDACLVHLKKCELFASVLPSKIFEIMAMGRPIIMGVEGEARDIVLQAGAGLEMEPDSARSLVNAVELLADNARVVAEQGQAARDYVARHYNRDELADRYLRLLAHVAGVARNEPETALSLPFSGTRDAAATRVETR
jgi:hypothetical protein